LSPFSEDCVLLSIPGTEALSPAVKYVIAFAIIFLLLALFALVLRRLTGGRLALPAHGRSRQPRLGIVDVYDLDRQRQLILLRRDNVEHLLLIGGPNDVVVETNIVRTPGARMPASAMDQNERPESFERSLEAPARPLIEPQRPEPVVARLGPADPTRVGSEHPVRNGPAAMHPEPILKPDVVALSPAPPPAPPRPAPHREPPQPTREPPPLHAVREAPAPPVRELPPPAPVREPVPPQPPVQRVTPMRQPPPPPPPEPPILRAAPEPARPPAPAPAPSKPDAAAGDAAVLSNMAKQLEEALKRPLSTGRQEPGAAAPQPNGPAPPFEDRTPRAVPTPARPQPAPPAAAARPAEPTDPPRPRPVPAPVTRMRPAAQPEAPPAPPPEPPPQPPGAEPQSDPFSVEEIEAEFARLLGRPLDRGERPH
jgi:hypothetical protein